MELAGEVDGAMVEIVELSSFDPDFTVVEVVASFVVATRAAGIVVVVSAVVVVAAASVMIGGGRVTAIEERVTCGTVGFT